MATSEPASRTTAEGSGTATTTKRGINARHFCRVIDDADVVICSNGMGYFIAASELQRSTRAGMSHAF